MAEQLPGSSLAQHEATPKAPPSGLRRGFVALAVRNYRLYWSGQVVSLIGS